MKNKFNIAMLGQKRVPSREGGIEVVVEELATRMVQKGHQVTCINRKGHNVAGEKYDIKSDNTFKGVHLKDVPTIDRRGLAAVSASFFATLHAAFGPYDVVHIHAEGPAFMCWLLKLFKKKVIVTVHGLDHKRAKWGRFASWYILCGEKMAVKHADNIIVLSKGVQDYFMDTYGRKTVFIPNAMVEKTILEPSLIIDQFGLNKDDYILFLGRLVPEKGCHYLIKAFKQVDTDKKLVIAGGISDTSEYVKSLHNLAKGDDRIIFTDFVQGATKHELYSNSYIYALPSDLEGMPLTLLEAMVYNNCCLTSDIPECTDVVDEKALTFKKSNISDLRRKLQFLVDYPEIVKKYKTDSREYILNKYNWDDIVERTLELYE